MSICTALETGEQQAVGMGQIVAARAPAVLTAVLGSCVGVALYVPRIKLGVLGHIVLPDSSGRDAPPGKFADRAIPAMFREIERLGVAPSAAVAKIAGGACMFGAGGPLQIGLTNVEAVIRALAATRIRLAGQDVGGAKGRRIHFHCDTGSLVVEIVGCPSRAL